MQIELNQLAKRYGYQYILRDINLSLENKISYAVSGPNGSGKSTFLKLISGYLSPSEGNIQYYVEDKKVQRDDIYKYISITAPYINLIPEYTLKEIFDFHSHFKSLQVSSFREFYYSLEYPFDRSLKFFEYSSGMQQRVKLALAILTNSELLLLDEPTTFLDIDAKKWFHTLLSQSLTNSTNRTTIICSNDQDDFKNCEKVLDISKWK